MADSANNETVLTANGLGVIADPLELSGSLDHVNNDFEGYYVFTLKENASVAASMTTTSGIGADLEIVNPPI